MKAKDGVKSLGARGYLVAAVLLCASCSSPLWGGVVLDLTAAGSSGSIGGAYFEQVDPQATGSGVIDPFVRLSTNQDVSEGYNTDARPLQFDENNSPQFTRSLLLESVPTVDYGGSPYKEFLLDINQNGTTQGRYLSLDAMQLYLAGSGDLTGYPALGTPIYDLDAGSDNWIWLNARLNHGSGTGDMLAYVPEGLVSEAAGPYVYIYSRFGEHYANNAGFEEWAVRTGQAPPEIPAPGAIVLTCIGVCVVGWLRRMQIA